MTETPNWPFWHYTSEEVFKKVGSSDQGLSEKTAKARFISSKHLGLKQKKTPAIWLLFFNQFKSPLILLLLACALLAFFLADRLDALIIIIILLISSLLGVIQEKGALNALKSLLKIVEVKCSVLRNHQEILIPIQQIVPGDILLLKAGDLIPADCLLIESNHLFINESALTGESQSVEKKTGPLPSDTSLSQRYNSLWMGTHVLSGIGKAIVIYTGKNTEFGKLSENLKSHKNSTDFEKGMQHFGSLLVQVTFVLVFIIFMINVLFKRPVLDSFLFSLALGIGLTPQLLPMIISVTLAKGAVYLSRKKVIVKRLASIENFGSMTILCSDKTGTLTTGEMTLQSFCDVDKHLSEKTLLFATLNAFFQSGFTNPLDVAILKSSTIPERMWRKLDEIPFNFSRKRLSLLVTNHSENFLIVKGAFSVVLSLCTHIEKQDKTLLPIDEYLPNLNTLQEECSKKNRKLLAIAYKNLDGQTSFSEDDEKDLIFLGYLEFSDPLKPDVSDQLHNLKRLGIDLKIISGDHHLIVQHIGSEIGLDNSLIMKGDEIESLSDQALSFAVEKKVLFAEINPLQKERIVSALQRGGHVVGFLGDGINDSVAMQKADVGISVQNGTNIAKESADFILLENDLKVLYDGVVIGRKTFANTLKYIFMATSANFGNMFSMAFSSLFLSFLPMLPKQVLLTNLFTDIPEFTISTDYVDDEWTISPQKWNLKFIRRFMIVFGLISSFYDFLTFFTLLWTTHSIAEFRTGWFIESVISASFVLLIVRTRHFVFKSMPSPYLLSAVIAIILATLLIPYTALGKIFGLVPLNSLSIYSITVIVLLYMTTAEYAKKIFYKYSI